MGGGYTHQTQGTPQALPALFKKLAERVDALNRRISNLGIQIDAVDNELIIASGRSLVVNGNTLINGNLSVPNGSITNDALQNPTAFATALGDTNSTTLTVAGANLAMVSIPVPAGFTQAQVVCIVSVGNTRNAGAGGAPFYVQSWVGGSTGGSALISADCEDNGSMSITVPWATDLTGLNGGNITAGAWALVDSTTGWKTGGANGHTVVSATFLR